MTHTPQQAIAPPDQIRIRYTDGTTCHVPHLWWAGYQGQTACWLAITHRADAEQVEPEHTPGHHIMLVVHGS